MDSRSKDRGGGGGGGMGNVHKTREESVQRPSRFLFCQCSPLFFSLLLLLLLLARIAPRVRARPFHHTVLLVCPFCRDAPEGRLNEINEIVTKPSTQHTCTMILPRTSGHDIYL